MFAKINYWFLTNNFFIAICAVAMLKYLSIATKITIDYHYFIISFFSTLCVYNFLRHSPFKFQSTQSFIIVVSAVISVCGVLLFFSAGDYLYIIPVFISLAYRYPIVMGTKLRTKPLLKLVAISVTWILLGIIPMLSQLQKETTLNKVIYTSLAQLMLVGGLSISFDVFDLKNDNTKTIGTVFGPAKSMIIAQLMTVSYLILNLLCATSSKEKISHAVVTVFVICVFFMYKKLSTKPLQHYFVDGLLIMQLAVILIFT